MHQENRNPARTGRGGAPRDDRASGLIASEDIEPYFKAQVQRLHIVDRALIVEVLR